MLPLFHEFLFGLAIFVAGFAGGYYLSHRGVTGIKSDLGDIKTDVEVLKAKFEAAKTAV